MKTAFITGGVFFLSYVAVNGGLGPNPLEVVATLAIVVGFSIGISWFLRQGRGGGRKRRSAEEELRARMPPTSPTARGAQQASSRTRPARKLF